MCLKKYKNVDSYVKHLAKIHRDDKCGCGGSGKKLLPNSFDQKMKRLREKIKQVDVDIDMDAITYGLRIDEKELRDLPLYLREKIRGLVMENEFLKGTIKNQEDQIKLMKKQVDKCIESAGVHLVVRE